MKGEGANLHPSTESCDGAAVLRALEAAAARLEARVDHVNQLNVYPVPDGDTGTNMLHTMRSALAAARRVEGGAGAVLAAAAQGALMGARGNSGVILSQILAGAKGVLANRDRIERGDLADAFAQGKELAYRALVDPVEGTILTAIREMAEALARSPSGTISELLDRAVAAGREATARTPELLPVHKRAGVVDAGAQGLTYLLEGAADLVSGRVREVAPLAEAMPAQTTPVEYGEGLGAVWGYDVQFLLPSPSRSVAALREEMLRFGVDDPSLGCVLVVGDESFVKVHVHTKRPDEILRIGLEAGQIRDVVVENLDAMAAERERATGVAVSAEDVATRPLAAVAVCSGHGIAAVCRSLGAVPLSGGPTLNPSVEELIRAIEGAGGEAVLVLPNDGNVLLAAERAAREARKPVRVVPTRTMAQGIAALVAFDAQGALDAIAEAMERSARSARTLEVTRAVRDANVGGVAIRAGEHMALVDGRVVGSGATAEEALAVAARAVTRAELCTVYRGADVGADRVERARSVLRETLGCEVEVVEGGQPHYPYIVSTE